MPPPVSEAALQTYRFLLHGHNMMLEPGWADVAGRIHSWLKQHDAAA